MKCLWVSRDIPFPLDAGDKIYSARLAQALAQADASLRFTGFLDAPREQVPNDWLTDWLAVNGAKRDSRAALLSRQPRIAAMHATPAYRQLLRQQLQQSWDAVALDGYGSGWALDVCLAAKKQQGERAPALIYVSHNHEESLWRGMVKATRPGVKKLALWQNYCKVRALERTLVKHADLITTITAEDACSYAGVAPRTPSVVLTPGYSGPVREQRTITEDTPRRVVMIGSFRWLIKQENLRRFIAIADPLFAAHGIALDIVGDVPAPLLQELRGQARATTFHGFVDDISASMERARLAVVPEMVGGGFKLKLLDYVFGRVPVASIAAAAAGLPSALRHCIFCHADLESLAHGIVANIDNVALLNRLQQDAFIAARSLFRWSDRGAQLRAAVNEIRMN